MRSSFCWWCRVGGGGVNFGCLFWRLSPLSSLSLSLFSFEFRSADFRTFLVVLVVNFWVFLLFGSCESLFLTFSETEVAEVAEAAVFCFLVFVLLVFDLFVLLLSEIDALSLFRVFIV